jgi:hypothetical protein
MYGITIVYFISSLNSTFVLATSHAKGTPIAIAMIVAKSPTISELAREFTYLDDVKKLAYVSRLRSLSANGSPEKLAITIIPRGIRTKKPRIAINKSKNNLSNLS